MIGDSSQKRRFLCAARFLGKGISAPVTGDDLPCPHFPGNMDDTIRRGVKSPIEALRLVTTDWYDGNIDRAMAAGDGLIDVAKCNVA